MNLLDSAYHVVHDYPGGSASLAPRLNKSPTTLSHEVTGTGSAKFGLVDACKVTRLTGDLRILRAFAEECGQFCVPLPDIAGSGDDDVMRALADSSGAFADLCREVCADMADGVISDNELRRLDLARSTLIAQLAHLGEVLSTVNLAGKPASQRIDWPEAAR